MLRKTFLILQSKDFLGKLYVVFYLSPLLFEVHLLSLNIFSATHNLSTSKVAMAMGMGLPIFFPYDFLRFVRENRIFLFLAGVFFISAVFSTIYSPFPKADEVKVLMRYAFIGGGSFVLVFLFWLKPELSLFFLKTVAVMTVISGVISIVEANSASVATWLDGFFGRGEHEMIQDRFRPAATFPHPNVLGCFMSIGVLLMVYLKDRKEIGRLVFFPSLIVLGIGIAFASSRNSFIVLTVPLLFLLFNRNTARTSLMALLLVAACIAASPAASISRLTELGDISKVVSLNHKEQGDKNDQKIEMQGSTNESGRYHLVKARLMLWTSAIWMFHDHPMIGIGPGRYNKALKSYAPDELLKVEKHKINHEWLHAHNGILNLLAEFGIVGTLPIVLIFTVLFVNLLKLYRFPPPQPVHAIPLGFVISFFFDAFLISAFYMILFISTALMLSNKKCTPS